MEILNDQNDTEIQERANIREAQPRALNDAHCQLNNLTKMRYRELIDDATFIKERNEIHTTIAKTKQSMKETEDRADKWLELMENTFEFACHAHKEFMFGDLQKKREMLMALGQNFSLKDQKLSIIPNDWLVPIIEKYPTLEKRYLAVGTRKYPSTARQKAAFAALRPDLRE